MQESVLKELDGKLDKVGIVNSDDKSNEMAKICKWEQIYNDDMDADVRNPVGRGVPTICGWHLPGEELHYDNMCIAV